MKTTKLMQYKGYHGSVEVSMEDEVLFGKIICINDLVNYEAETFPELKVAFQEAVDDYLETCKDLGRNPDKPMSGTFNVRIGQDLHKRASVHAYSQGISLNELIKTSLDEKLKNSPKDMHLHLHLEQKNTKVFKSDFDNDKLGFESVNFDTVDNINKLTLFKRQSSGGVH